MPPQRIVFLVSSQLLKSYYSRTSWYYFTNQRKEMIDLLQISDSLNKVAAQINVDRNNDGSISFMELLFMGGWIMVPLAIMLLLAIYVFTERYIAIRNASNIDQNFMNIVRDHIVSGNLVAARSFAKNSNNPVARIIDKGLQRVGKPIENIEKSMIIK
jgi:biopolymer transport protein ExbB